MKNEKLSLHSDIEKVCGEQGHLNHSIAYNYLDGKNLCLVGGARYADEIPAAFFRRYVVMQVNHHPKRRTHQPCHWWVTRPNAFLSIDELKVFAAPMIVSTPINKQWFLPMNEYAFSLGAAFIPWVDGQYTKANPYHYSLEWCNAFHNQLDTMPFVGVLALQMALRFPVRSIFLTGFDFYAEHRKDKTGSIESHGLKPQMKWMKEIWNQDFRVRYDRTLMRILGLDEKKRAITPTQDLGERVTLPAYED